MDTKGAQVIQAIWFSYSQRIVHEVIRILELNEEQAEVIKSLYLVPGNFKVVLAD